MKLEVGMYVRTKRDGIGKIISLNIGVEDDECCFIELSKRRTGIKEYNILKASHNIIDLIEVGDYVNGKLVSSLPLFKNEFIFEEPVNGFKYIKGIAGTPIEDNKCNFIKSIVTKEQFESMSYKVGE